MVNSSSSISVHVYEDMKVSSYSLYEETPNGTFVVQVKSRDVDLVFFFRSPEQFVQLFKKEIENADTIIQKQKDVLEQIVKGKGVE